MEDGPGEAREERRDTVEMDAEELKRLVRESSSPPPTSFERGDVAILDDDGEPD